MNKIFCIKCKKTNNCSCDTDLFHLEFSHKFRPPKLKSNGKINKPKWKNFLHTNPSFPILLDSQLIYDWEFFLIEIGFSPFFSKKNTQNKFYAYRT